MYQKEKTVVFGGHRYEKLPKVPGILRTLKMRAYIAFDQAIKNGYDTFIMEARDGFALLAAEMLLLRKEAAEHRGYPKIRLIAAVPYEKQAAGWNEEQRAQYFGILARCDEVMTLLPRYRPGCFRECSHWMADRASRLICYYDGNGGRVGYTVNYTRKQGLDVVNLYSDEKKG